MAKFAAGDKVLWSHEEASKHGEGSIIKASALPGAPIGTIVGAANDAETWWTVEFPDGEKVLTGEELVKAEV